MHYIYILANTMRGTLYIGTTRNLEHRIVEHKTKTQKCFTKKYNVSRLVYYEEFETALEAVAREKQLKKWNRQWKIDLVEDQNPKWKDLSADWY